MRDVIRKCGDVVVGAIAPSWARWLLAHSATAPPMCKTVLFQRICARLVHNSLGTTEDFVVEALALLEWAQRQGAQAVIISGRHLRSFEVCAGLSVKFAGQPIGIKVPSFDPPQYTRANWWTDDQGIVSFQSEILKFVYYQLKY
jgi:hypothetical protein